MEEVSCVYEDKFVGLFDGSPPKRNASQDNTTPQVHIEGGSVMLNASIITQSA